MSHFLQGVDWEAFQASLGRQVQRLSGDGWTCLVVEEEGRLGTRWYAPYGPTVESPAALADAVRQLSDKGREAGVDFLRLEPVGPVTRADVAALGALPVDYAHLQPDRTQVVPLAGDEAALVAGMKQSNRSVVRNFAKKGIEVTTSTNPEDMEVLLGFLHQVADRNDVALQGDDYLRRQARALMPRGAAMLYVARLEGEPIAAALCYDGEDTRYYAHAGADDEHRKLSAPTILIGRMMIDAQAAGMAAFDLYGIGPEDDPDHPWSGFTRFKQGFGGEPVDYVGAWDVPLRPLRYRLYRAALHLAADDRTRSVLRRARAAVGRARGLLRR